MSYAPTGPEQYFLSGKLGRVPPGKIAEPIRRRSLFGQNLLVVGLRGLRPQLGADACMRLKLRSKGCRDTCHPFGCGLPLLRGYERLQQKGTTSIAARLR